MGLQGIGPEYEGPAKGQFGVGNLQLDAMTSNHRPVFAPVELEGFPGLEAQGHENTPTRCLACLVLFVFPLPDESGHPSVGSIITQCHKVFM